VPDDQNDWYSVRCVFVTAAEPTAYEERVTVWRAAGFAEATALAETEATEYAAAAGCRYLHLAQAFHLADDLAHGAEVYSLIRESSLPAGAYLSRFFDTGTERHAALDQPPSGG
jgi:hypothetical protein